MANAPVKTASMPAAGAESYVGIAVAMELAMEELSRKFPSFFPNKTEQSGSISSNRFVMHDKKILVQPRDNIFSNV